MQLDSQNLPKEEMNNCCIVCLKIIGQLKVMIIIPI